VTTTTDTLISIAILLIIGLIIYSRYNNQSIVQTIKDIKESLNELKKESKT
jgi:hypothetical protein